MFKSLKFKIILMGFTVVSLIMLTGTIRDVIITKEQLLKTQEEKTTLLSDRILHGIMVLMISNRWEELQKMVENLTKGGKELKEIRIFLPETGIIKVSSRSDEIGKKIYEEDYAKALNGDDKTFLIEKNGTMYASKITFIKNMKACYGCHGYEKDVLGILDIELSLEPMYATINEFKNRHIRNGVVGFILVIMSFAIIITFLIDKPIHKMIDTIRRVEKGDLSARMEMNRNDELGLLARSFNEMVSSLERAKQEIEEYHRQQIDRAARLASIGEVASGIAHEIRNPLTSISCAIQLLQSEFKDDLTGKKIIYEIQNQIKRLDNTIKDLLNYAKPTAPVFTPTNIGDVIQRAMFFVSAEAKKSGVSIEIDKMEGFPHIMMDGNQMQQVFMNIMINAIQAMPSGGSLKISLRMGDRRDIEGCLGQTIKSEKVLIISFEDTGVGIHPDDIKNIFEPFFTRKTKGSGLGLSISRRIVREHGGDITCTSTLNMGTIFTIYLPLNGLL